MRYRKLVSILTGIFAASSFAASTPTVNSDAHQLLLPKRTGFFRFSYDDMQMPNHMERMGLLGINYFTDFTPYIYGGIGAYGAVNGKQGGLFTLGLGAGLHRQFAERWWGDMGLYVGGGGGRSSLVGGGLIVRPHIGIEYDFRWARLGLHYSYIDFPNGQIHGQQVGADLDIPLDFYYVRAQDIGNTVFKFKDIHLIDGKRAGFQRNDFGVLLQAYRQKSGTRSVDGRVQDGTMNLVGAELDHFITDSVFWWARADGAYHGVPNGYMDVLGGLGYHWSLGSSGFAIVPQFGAGAGGGGNVDTGGGVLIQPQLGVEIPITSSIAARVGGGYLWAPQGQLSAYTVSGEILYHLDIVSANGRRSKIQITNLYKPQGWRIQAFNQTYIHPQRVNETTTSPDNLVGVQIDQIFTPHFFFSYQAASAYAGVHAGGFATGMIGPGLQTSDFWNHRMELFGEVLIGAGGGGGLQIAGGSIIEPLVGLRYSFTPAISLQGSVGQVLALRSSLSTPVVNIGVAVKFGTLNLGTADKKIH